MTDHTGRGTCRQAQCLRRWRRTWRLLHAHAAVILLAALQLRTVLSASAVGYSALCAVGKNENRYVREWVEYHKCLGFSRIYMYDHNSTVPMSSEIQDHVDSGFVQYIDYSGVHTKFKEGYTSNFDRFMATIQGQAYKDCVDRFGGLHTFLGFIDLDEFLVIYDPGVSSVNDLLKDYEAYPGLSIYWVVLGSSGHKKRPPGYVITSYTRCTPHTAFANTQFKTFANTRFKPTMYSPHRAFFNASDGGGGGGSSGGADGSSDPYMVNEHFQRIQRGRNKNATHDRAAVFHYAVKSKEDFLYKMRRGGGAGVTRPRSYIDIIDRTCTKECGEAIATYARFCKEDPPGYGSNTHAHSFTKLPRR